MPKNIVFFADGSGNSGQPGKETNVHKLFQMIDASNPRLQISKYIKGVGTDSNYFKAKFGFFTGQGISMNILSGYRYLCENYQPGDKIYLFGFSRGAATVRSLTGMINDVGLLPVDQLGRKHEAYEIYRITDDSKRNQKARQFVAETKGLKPEIHFIGVWDTVAAIGLQHPILNRFLNLFSAIQHKFHNFTLVPLVKHARHAIAIDERRVIFSPVLWDSKTEAHQTLKQVWFAGVHKNVGGGWIKDKALSDIPLQWMIGEAKEAGLKLNPNHQIRMNPDPMGTIRWQPILSLNKRQWDIATQGKPTVHESVLERSKNDPGYKPWILELDYAVSGVTEFAKCKGY